MIDTRNGDPTPIGGYALGGTTSSYAFRALGESFIAPTGFADLQSFAFFLTRSPDPNASDDPATHDFSFTGSIFAFDGTAPVGSALFTSPTMTVLATDPADQTAEELFTTGGLALTPGQMYVALIQAVDNPSDGGRSVSFLDTDTYADGIIYANPGIFPGFFDGQDLALVANFGATSPVSSTPEPGTLMLFGSGMLAVAGVVRRKSRR